MLRIVVTLDVFKQRFFGLFTTESACMANISLKVCGKGTIRSPVMKVVNHLKYIQSWDH